MASAAASAPPAPAGLKRVVAASLIGTTIEWYDFFLYGSAAALVFNKLFFPDSDPLVGTLLSFLTYAVGFAARPLGALVFGHYGDRVGRKRLLVLSLLLMGGATFAIGLLPTHATVGAAAPVLLTTLRLIQGFALGGEWGGAVLLVSEHGDARRRGFWASWPQTGAPAGQLLATGVLSLLTAVLSDDAFASWGWRIPFLLSGVLVVVGLWIRLSVDESPVFQRASAQAEARRTAGGSEGAGAEKPPLVSVLRHHWRDVLVAMGARMAENISYYVITAFILVYATTSAGVSKQTALNAVLIASAVHFAVIPAWGALEAAATPRTSVPAAACSAPSRSVRSRTCGSTPPARPRACSTSVSRPPASRSTALTFAPAAARRSAQARPMPPAAPVTRAVRPPRSSGVGAEPGGVMARPWSALSPHHMWSPPILHSGVVESNHVGSSDRACLIRKWW